MAVSSFIFLPCMWGLRLQAPSSPRKSGVGLRPCRPAIGVSRPSGPKTAKKSQRNPPRCSGPKKKSGKGPKTLRKVSFWRLFDLFRTFSETPGRKAREDVFETSWFSKSDPQSCHALVRRPLLQASRGRRSKRSPSRFAPKMSC